MMFGRGNRSWKSWGSVAAAMALSACAASHPRTNAVEPVPAQAAPKVTIEIDVDTLEVRLVQPEGARNCSLCTPELQSKYGSACEKAPQAGIPICAGLVDATVQELGMITLARSHKNPYCVTIASSIVGGTSIATQLCFCQPTDPPGACPAPAWIQ